METRICLVLAAGVLGVHLGFNVWVVFGAFFTRGRRRLSWLHILSVIYGATMEAVPVPCPLTLLEKWLGRRGGMVPYQGPFLLHYLNEIVYPHFPLRLLVWGAAGVCLANLSLYVWRYSHDGF